MLVDVGTRLEPTGVERIVGFMTAHPDGFESIEEAAAAVSSYLPHRRGRIQPQRSFARNLRCGVDGRYRWHWDPALLHGRKALTDDERDHIQQQLREAARRLQTPTLLVRGGRSAALGPGGVEEFRTLVPHAEYVELPSATHMVVGDRNDAFTRAIAGFLDAHRPHGLASRQP